MSVDLYRIGARKSILQSRNENIQGKRIPWACESVYHVVFVPHRETMRSDNSDYMTRIREILLLIGPEHFSLLLKHLNEVISNFSRSQVKK